jgi:hypothetical protein
VRVREILGKERQMATLEARYRVRDRDAFMDAFAAFRPIRMELGVTACRVLGGDEDPSDVVVMFELPDCDAARTYAADPRRQEALKKAGVTDCTDVVLEELRSATI